MAVYTINGLSLCAGYDGIGLGLRLALGDAYRTVCAVEIEAFAAAVLVARQQDGSLPPFPIWDDLATFDGRPWRGVVDIVTAGLPCQPYSVAGKQLGHDDERAIWPEFIRIVGEVRAPVVFIENVPAFVQYFRPVGEALSDLGYRIAAGIFSAAEVGSSHRRERVFILAVADAGRERDQRRQRPPELGAATSREPSEASQQRLRYAVGDGSTDVADAECAERRAETLRGGHAGEGCNGQGQAAGGLGERSRVLADAEDERHEWDGAAWGRWSGSPLHRGPLADAESRRPRPAGDAPRQDGQPRGAGADVADAGRLSEGWSAVAGETSGGRAQDGFAGCSDVLEYANVAGLEGRGVSGGGRADEWTAWRPSSAVSLFPPGPGERERWADILRERTDLAPAVEAQQSLRRLDDGPAGELVRPDGASRSDMLRLLGNGCVPSQVAGAFIELWRRIHE